MRQCWPVVMALLLMLPLTAATSGSLEDRYDTLTADAAVFERGATPNTPCEHSSVVCFPLDGTKMRARFEIVDDVDPRPVAAWISFQSNTSTPAWNALICSGADLPIRAGNSVAKIWIPRTSGLVDADKCESSLGPLQDWVATPTRGTVRMTWTPVP